MPPSTDIAIIGAGPQALTLVTHLLQKKAAMRLGAHYTPRSYVERLVRPVVMEPLRQEWDDIELKRLPESVRVGSKPA